MVLSGLLKNIGLGVNMTEVEYGASISEILAYLDGRGLILTDEELIEEALSYFNLTPDTTVGWVSEEE